MKYKVLDIFQVGTDSSVTIDGRGEGLHNGMTIFDDNGNSYHLMSIAMLSEYDTDEIGKTTTLLIKGKFVSEYISV